MPWANLEKQATMDGRDVPKRCRICSFSHELRQFIEDCFDEGMVAREIKDLLVKPPYNMKITDGLIRKHCKEHMFLRHLEEKVAQDRGIDLEAQRVMEGFLERKSILWEGPYSVPPEMLDAVFDPVKRLQELFFIQYVRFVKILTQEATENVFLKETRELGRELHALLTSLHKMSGDASDEPGIKEAAMTMVLVKTFDAVSPAQRQMLVDTLENYKQATGEEEPQLVEVKQ